MNAQRLVIWNVASPEWERLAVDTCRRRGVEPWLWYPVFADNAALRPHPSLWCKTACGVPLHDCAGRWIGAGPDEDFLFFCPTSNRVAEIVERDLAEAMGRHEWAGVFFDRMRYPSPANGIEALGTCFCRDCTRAMGESGLDADDVAAALSRALDDAVALSHAGVHGSTRRTPVDTQQTLLTRHGLLPWITFRCDTIAERIGLLAGQARRKGLSVGLDLFSPSLASFVGQAYDTLAPLADWIKPMTYFRAPGPAGFPVERASLRDGMCIARGMDEEAACACADQLVGRTPATYAIGAAINGEMDLVRRAIGGCRTTIVPGVELVDIPEIGIYTDARTARSILTSVRSESAEISVSWNILAIPERVASVVGEMYA